MDARLLARIRKGWRIRVTSPASQWLALTFLVALSYCLTGRMGQLLAFPPNYATTLWPPSGIALAAVLLIGRQALPGVFLGALIANCWSPWFAAPSLWTGLSGLFHPIVTSLGATSQAWLGGYLIRRFVGFPNPLIYDRQIIAFLALGGPVACLVAPTCGVAMLIVAGSAQHLSSIALNWWAWWVGDMVGVLIFTPLVLIAFARPRKVWRPRWISVSLPLIGAITVSVLGFVVAQILGGFQSATHFERIADTADQLIDHQIKRHLEVIDSLQRFFALSRAVDREEFVELSQDTSRYCEAVQMIAWVPRETASPGDHSNQDFTPTDRFQVAFVYPQQAQILNRGDDFAAHLNWQDLMRRCCDSGKRLASSPFLVNADGTSDDRHVLVLAPVYHRGSALESIQQRRQSLRGFVVGIVGIDALVRSSTPAHDIGMLAFHVMDVTDPENSETVYRERSSPSAHKSSEMMSTLRPGLGLWSDITFADRLWSCHYTPTPMFYAGQENRHRWMILTSGLALTAVLGAFLLVLSGRTAQIESSKARYLDLYENAPDMFLSLDVGSQRVIECNRTFLDSTGLQKYQVIDKHMVELFDPESHTEARRAFRIFRMTGHVGDIEMQLLCHDGSIVDISMKMSAVRDEDGESIVCRAALRDITARKRVEAEFKAQEMELAHAARLTMMGEMATGLAHEINQPLGAIAAYAEGALIRLRDGKPDMSKLSVILERIAHDAHRAGQIIRRLRQFLRKRSPERMPIRINDLVREVAQFVDADLRRREVRIGIDLGSDLPMVQGDPIQLQQVLLNLVRNGCDAMLNTPPARRSLMIRTHCRDLENIDVTVEDCGHGLSATINDQLFEAFFSTKDEGLGMGLAISRSIIESHGGQIWATSNLEGGASFHFSLPAIAKVCA